MSGADSLPTGSALPAFGWRPVVIVLAVQVVVLTALSLRRYY